MRSTSPWILALALSSLAACAPKGPTAPPIHTAQPPAATVEHPASTPRPSVAAHDLIGFESTTAARFVKAEQSADIVVRLRLGAKALKNAPRAPLNLGLVVDTSGSMEGNAIKDAREACLMLLDSLSEGDRISVVVFHSDAQILVPMTELTKENRALIRQKMSAMQANGTTEMAGGLSLGLAEVTKGFQANGVNRIVLLGDGVPNSEANILSFAQTSGQRSISITALGLGLDYNETLMNAIAQHSGGKYHFIKESSQVAAVFEDEVVRLKRVVGRAAALRLKPGPGVTVKEVVGLTYGWEGQALRVPIGDMSEGDQRDVIVRLSAPGRRAGAVVELLDTELVFGDGQQSYSEKSFVAARASADAKEIEQGRDLEVEKTAARIGVANLILRAVAARAGNAAAGLPLLDQAEKEAKAALKLADDADLREKLKSIGPLRESLAALARQQQQMQRQQQLQQHFPDRPVPRPAVAMPAMAPAAAAVVMRSHADAAATIQGE